MRNYNSIGLLKSQFIFIKSITLKKEFCNVLHGSRVFIHDKLSVPFKKILCKGAFLLHYFYSRRKINKFFLQNHGRSTENHTSLILCPFDTEEKGYRRR